MATSELDGFRAAWVAARPPGRMLFGRLAGSRAYGTETPASDWDWAGVYVIPAALLLRLDVPPDVVSRTKGQRGGGDDWTFHDAGKFVSILLKGNANALDALFAPEETVFAGEPDYADLWRELRGRRQAFLSRVVLHHYMAYAGGQLKRIRDHCLDGKVDDKVPDPVDRWKDAGHGVRLLYEARRIARGQEPVVRWAKGTPENEVVARVRAGDMTPEAVLKVAGDLACEIDAADRSHLVEDGPRAYCNDWLLRLRLKTLT